MLENKRNYNYCATVVHVLQVVCCLCLLNSWATFAYDNYQNKEKLVQLSRSLFKSSDSFKLDKNSVTDESNDPHNIKQTGAQSGRHICSGRKNTVPGNPVKTVSTHQKPVYKSHSAPCSGNKCQGVRVEQETGYKETYHQKKLNNNDGSDSSCCPGWMPKNSEDQACSQAVCKNGCLNGGSCISPETCACKPGYTGKICDADINECQDARLHKCDQICENTQGGYRCKCFEHFVLQSDGHKCKSESKDQNGDGIPKEPDDLDTDIMIDKTDFSKFWKDTENDNPLSTPSSGSADKQTLRKLQSEVAELKQTLQTASKQHQEQSELLLKKLNEFNSDCQNTVSVFTKRIDSCCKPGEADSIKLFHAFLTKNFVVGKNAFN